MEALYTLNSPAVVSCNLEAITLESMATVEFRLLAC